MLFNGVEFQLKKVFGQIQYPIDKTVHFISQRKHLPLITHVDSILFFVGNYIALHNVLRDETRYIGIEANLSKLTAFDVYSLDSLPPVEKSVSPVRTTLHLS